MTKKGGRFVFVKTKGTCQHIGRGTGSGNPWEWGHYKYETCPSCGKKGFFKPKSDTIIVGGETKTIDYPKTCRLCEYSEASEKSSQQLGFPEKIFKKGDRVVYDNPESAKLGTLGHIVGTKGEYAIIKLDTGEMVKTHTTFVKKPLKTLIGKKQWR